MRTILCLAVCLLLLGAATARAEGIVVFDLQKVAAESEALQEAKKALDDKFGPQKKELEKERAALEKQAEQLQKAQAEKDAKKRPSEKQLQSFAKKQREYGEKAQAFMRLLQADELRVRQDIDTVIGEAAKSLGQRKGYSMILDAALVPYSDPKLDVTNDMLTETNAAWKRIRKELTEGAKPEDKPAADKPAAPANP